MASRNKHKASAPYTKYKKKPYRYSDELNNWTIAVKKGDKAAVDRHDRAWKNRFGINARPVIHNPLDQYDIDS